MAAACLAPMLLAVLGQACELTNWRMLGVLKSKFNTDVLTQ